MKCYKQIQILSIDVALGSCAMAYLLAQVLSIQIPFIIYFSLGMCVWLIYTIDHLMDATKMQGNAVSPRHVFHQKYFEELAWIWLVVFVLTGFLSLAYLPIQTIKLGIIAAIFVVVHFVLVNFLGSKISVLVQKEFGVAISYLLGVSVGPLSLIEVFPSYLYWVLAQIFLYAFINLLQFSYFETEVDSQQGQTSIARSIGSKYLGNIINGILILALIVNIYCFKNFSEFLNIQSVLFVMYLALALLFLAKKHFQANEKYRLLGDMVFIFPLVLLFL